MTRSRPEPAPARSRRSLAIEVRRCHDRPSSARSGPLPADLPPFIVSNLRRRFPDAGSPGPPFSRTTRSDSVLLDPAPPPPRSRGCLARSSLRGTNVRGAKEADRLESSRLTTLRWPWPFQIGPSDGPPRVGAWIGWLSRSVSTDVCNSRFIVFKLGTLVSAHFASLPRDREAPGFMPWSRFGERCVPPSKGDAPRASDPPSPRGQPLERLSVLPDGRAIEADRSPRVGLRRAARRSPRAQHTHRQSLRASGAHERTASNEVGPPDATHIASHGSDPLA